jgi:hypothetical protein
MIFTFTFKYSLSCIVVGNGYYELIPQECEEGKRIGQGLSKRRGAQGHFVVMFLSLTNGTCRISAAAATNGNRVWSPLNSVLYSQLCGNASGSSVDVPYI